MQEVPTPVQRRAVWAWVAGCYVFQALPAAVRDEALPVALRNLGSADAGITRIQSALGLIFGFKVLMAPFIAAFRPRPLIVLTQASTAVLLLLAGCALPYLAESGGAPVVACLVLLSVVAAAHDFALDGYFVASLDERSRASHSGLLNVASKVGSVLAGPCLIGLAGMLIHRGEGIAAAWSTALLTAAGFALALSLINLRAFRDEPEHEADGMDVRSRLQAMGAGLRDLLRDPRLPAVAALILLYRASEIHMARILPLYSLAPLERGGLALDNETYALIRMFTAVGGLAAGGVIGSIVVTRLRVGNALLPLGLAMHAPLLAVTWLAYGSGHSVWTVGAVFFIEYLAYGAGLCALLLSMMKLAEGASAAVRYAALSTLALIATYLPGLWAGWLAQEMGYARYFLFSLALALPGMAAAVWARRHFRDA
ncbi:MAG: AmpG family muropeptide MFS transporter [Verrucomicrobia bacterium]|nr:AmpG family muropeptide MFS transporter [Verrucomicrobiota bacterium]